MNRLIRATQLWAIDKGLDTADPAKQLLKVFEETAEVSQAYMRNQEDELLMEIGDVFVTIIIFAQQNGIEPEDALKKAYDKISNRNGELINGTYVKEEDLSE